jgi:hypothetical protein
MQHDFSQQSPRPGSLAAHRPHALARLNLALATSSRGYAASIAGLGLMIGAVIAFSGCRAHSAASPKPSSTTNPHPASAVPLAAATMPAPTIVSPLEEQKKSVAGAPLPKPISLTSIRKSPAVKQEQSAPRALPVTRIFSIHETVSHRPYTSLKLRAAAAPPAAVDITNAAVARPFFVGIEGDLTVASYDATGGTVETYEGSNFVLDPGAGDDDSIPWQEFPFSIHYRCEESGKCILVRGGAKAVARMAR